MPQLLVLHQKRACTACLHQKVNGLHVQSQKKKKKNGQKYCDKLNENLCLSPGKNTLKHANNVDSCAKKRYEMQSTIEAKRRRLITKK